MAEVKFAKGSEEWQMFMDFWALCQKYWEPEDSDEWWEETLREIDVFAKKYGSIESLRRQYPRSAEHPNLTISHPEKTGKTIKQLLKKCALCDTLNLESIFSFCTELVRLFFYISKESMLFANQTIGKSRESERESDP